MFTIMNDSGSVYESGLSHERALELACELSDARNEAIHVCDDDDLDSIETVKPGDTGPWGAGAAYV